MFRFTVRKLFTSPYFLFVHDVQKKNPVKGKGFQKKLSKMYHSLPEAQKQAYLRRARLAKNPGRDEFRKLQKQYNDKLTHLPVNKRAAAVSALLKQKRAGAPINVEGASSVALRKAKVVKPVAKPAAKTVAKKLKVASKSKQVRTVAKKVKKSKK
ncbi:kinetoplast DNA-associated protein [Strigomonas culicis]|uniref:Kinetoplast DNA-associated protein n=1 Tax=Strigomonas culicis TaxID=28005 RepID=S9UW67_9TRYP|nr:kinetoplast DNA-associated protein [Strigomonas culicis]|eukprot:EPY33108.1 kinetoplast DNA-associated protein [Strigomonas culicis]